MSNLWLKEDLCGGTMLSCAGVSAAWRFSFFLLPFCHPCTLGPSSARCCNNNTDQAQTKHSHSGRYVSAMTRFRPDLLICSTEGSGKNGRNEASASGMRSSSSAPPRRTPIHPALPSAFCRCPSSKKHISRRPRLNYLKSIVIDLYPNSSERYIKI